MVRTAASLCSTNMDRTERLRNSPGGSGGLLHLLESQRCCEEEDQEEAQARGWRRAQGASGGDGGGPDVRIQEGREGDVGDQSGAGVVDEGLDLLRLLAARFHLKDSRGAAEWALCEQQGGATHMR